LEIPWEINGKPMGFLFGHLQMLDVQKDFRSEKEWPRPRDACPRVLCTGAIGKLSFTLQINIDRARERLASTNCFGFFRVYVNLPKGVTIYNSN
jgi:hypothetical protein